MDKRSGDLGQSWMKSAVKVCKHSWLLTVHRCRVRDDAVAVDRGREHLFQTSPRAGHVSRAVWLRAG